MKSKHSLLLCLAIFCSISVFARQKNQLSHTVIEGDLPPGYSKSEISIETFSEEWLNLHPDTEQQDLKQNAKPFMKWNYVSANPGYVMGAFIPGDRLYYIEPGDSIHISYENGKPFFTGKGAEKFKLQHAIFNMQKAQHLPAEKTAFLTNSVSDYLEWNLYCNNMIRKSDSLVSLFKNKIGRESLELIRAHAILVAESKRIDAFHGLFVNLGKYEYNANDLVAIYDSALFQEPAKWMRSFPRALNRPTYFYQFNSLAAYRKVQFDKVNTGMASKATRRTIYYPMVMANYKGDNREQTLVFMLTSSGIGKVGFVPEMDSLLAQYYKSTASPRYKAVVKQYEEHRRNLLNSRNAAEWELENSSGKQIRKNNFNGKVLVMDFWFSGCKGCAADVPYMKKVEKYFEKDTNVVFASICVDEQKERWLKSVAQAKFTTGGGINLYTGGKGSNHEMMKDYMISGYPTVLIIDAEGRLVNPIPKVRASHNNGMDLIAKIRQQLILMEDGPYVRDNKAYSLVGNKILERPVSRGAEELMIVTDIPGVRFPVRLKTKILPEPSIHESAEKMLVLSDIEGEFGALRKLLVANKVIDENFKWIFGKGHLAFIGDMFDRGEQVNECLWLIYSLEEQAKAADGYVHFVLGNHEIMNLQGNHKYAKQKYITNAVTLGTNLRGLYGNNTELGNWLRSKNIIEKTGNLLLVHGGIGEEFADAVSLGVEEINHLARKYYDDTLATRSSDKDIRMIFDQWYGPFWFRRYYKGDDKVMELASDTSVKFVIKHPDEEAMDNILKRFGVQHIITGHSVVADTISTHYNNKVINTDTKHAKGKSEALLVEGTKFYRVNVKGERWLLFDDRKSK